MINTPINLPLIKNREEYVLEKIKSTLVLTKQDKS